MFYSYTAPDFQRLLGFKFIPDLKWCSYMQTISKDTRKMVELLCQKVLDYPPLRAVCIPEVSNHGSPLLPVLCNS